MKVDIVVEIPMGSRNKYEFDKKAGVMRLDRVVPSAVVYPGEYAYMPETLCDDGDELDFVNIVRFPTFPGCVVPVRPIAMFEMIDTGEKDDKVISVPVDDPYFDNWNDLEDIPEALREEISEYFATYKNLHKNKNTEVKEWKGVKEAEKLIEESKKQYESKGK